MSTVVQEQWWVLVSTSDHAQAFAVIGPFHSESAAKAEAEACGCPYVRIGNRL